MEQPGPMLSFTLIHTGSSDIGPRLGQLILGGRKTINTPHYVTTSSRGVVPHISHDTLRRRTEVAGIYLGLEDCQ